MTDVTAALRSEVTGLQAAHPDLPPFGAIDAVTMYGHGRSLMVQLPDPSALRAWAKALGVPVQQTGAASFGHTTPAPGSSSLPDYAWWRALLADITFSGVTVRLWTLETTDHARVLGVAVVSTLFPYAARKSRDGREAWCPIHGWSGDSRLRRDCG